MLVIYKNCFARLSSLSLSVRNDSVFTFLALFRIRRRRDSDSNHFDYSPLMKLAILKLMLQTTSNRCNAIVLWVVKFSWFPLFNRYPVALKCTIPRVIFSLPTDLVLSKEYRLQLRKPHWDNIHLVHYQFCLVSKLCFLWGKISDNGLLPGTKIQQRKTREICWLCYENPEKEPNLLK